jgi:hypothetical protein
MKYKPSTQTARTGCTVPYRVRLYERARMRRIRRFQRNLKEENRLMARRDKIEYNRHLRDFQDQDMQAFWRAIPVNIREWIGAHRDELFADKPKKFLRRQLVPLYIGPQR